MKKIFKKIIIKILQWEASLVLRKYKPKIVAVTGSVGKTSTKDAIYTVLSSSFFVRKSEKSFNSDIGVPLSILGCQNGKKNPIIWIKNIIEGLILILFKNHYPHWLVLEVGADKSGDIENIAKWLKPDIAVITRFAEVPVHVENFKSPKEVIKEKKKLVKFLKKDGSLVLNYDDKEVLKIKDEFNRRFITYGLEEGSDVTGSNLDFLYEEDNVVGISFKVDAKGSSVPLNIRGVLGVHQNYPALAAIAVGLTQGLNLVTMSQILSEKYESQPGRMKIIEGVKNSLIIDDSYNSSPLAVEWALKTLNQLETKGKKIAVLGDMMELGKFSLEEHKKVGERVAKTCDMLLTVGVRAKDISKGAISFGMNEKNIFHFENSQKAGAYLQNLIREGDIILVKGSRWATRMEQAVEEIMAHPEIADKLLVR